MSRKVAQKLKQSDAPTKSNKFYLSPSGGGYNDSLIVSSPSVLPNCVGYARGRFCEIAGKWINPVQSDGGGMFDAARYSKSWRTGTKPQEGAMICWGKAGEAGHVAVVEKVHSDGKLTISHSGYKQGYSFSSILTKDGKYNELAFWTTTYGPPNYLNWSGYYLQGFIYNPAILSREVTLGQTIGVDAQQAFLKNAMNAVGKDWRYANQYAHIPAGLHWCVAFVISVKNQTGGLDNVLGTSWGVGDFVKQCISKGKGNWTVGPAQGNFSFVPRAGDLITFRWNPNEYPKSNKTSGDHIGIVTDCRNGLVYTVEGNSGSGGPTSTKVRRLTYKVNDVRIAGYFRPNWDGVASVSGSGSVGRLYEGMTLNDEKDASIREVGYLADNMEFSARKSNIKLSVINYTSGLAAIFNTLVVPTYSNGVDTDVNFDGTKGNERVIAEFIIKTKGLSKAAAVGWLCNMYYESALNPAAVGDGDTSGGICQWHAGRFANMKTFVGNNWKQNLTGQLNFWYHELSSSYTDTFNKTKSVPNTLEGAKELSKYITIHFERPADMYRKAEERAARASYYWSHLVPQI